MCAMMQKLRMCAWSILGQPYATYRREGKCILPGCPPVFGEFALCLLTQVLEVFHPTLSMRCECVADRFRDCQVPEPLSVRGDDEPRGVLRTALREHVLKRLGVLVPKLPLLPVSGRQLPGLRLIFLPSEKPLLLLILIDMEIELEDDGVRLGKRLLERVDPIESLF